MSLNVPEFCQPLGEAYLGEVQVHGGNGCLSRLQTYPTHLDAAVSVGITTKLDFITDTRFRQNSLRWPSLYADPSMLIQLLPLLLICILGAALKRWGLLQPHDTQPLSCLLTILALPAVILKALTTATITPDLIYLPVAALIVVMGLTLISLGAAYWLKGDRPVVGALVTAFPTFEGGGVGYPLMLLTFGEWV